MIDFDQLDKTIHEKGRLSIMTLLAGRAGWSFQDLKQELGMSDGNLITHLRTLAAAGYTEEKKDGTGSRPRTTYHLTAAGKLAFEEYLDVLESIVKTLRPD
ncbi:MAG TPA: transcriptional regulator [Verrucomicrobiales bacterium]|nr:transcriptional regulator [Verrucomicrobiales bacterium]HCN76412.1 transcriptional regulator [Verrucomicrobiales bacterium]HRJ08203.1 transcriptional regulator [Prosthecobacter sp.]HRK16126.1 transcriptional regulator [Prosthecobacter sp.]